MSKEKEYNRHDEYHQNEQLERSTIEVSAYITIQHHPEANDDDILDEALMKVEAGEAHCYDDPRIINQEW